MSPNEAARILSLAIKNGVDTIDTAISYGEAENIIGKYCKRNVKIVTKLPELKKSEQIDDGYIRELVEYSLQKLGRDSMYGLLLHKPLQLCGANGKALFKSLKKLKVSGKVEKKLGCRCILQQN